MRILYHHRTSSRDGSAVHIESLVAALRSLGAEVSISAPSIAESGPSSKAKTSWIQHLRRRLPRCLHEAAEVGYNLPEAVRLRRAVRSFRPDVIYQRSNLFLLSGAWIARSMNLPLIEEVNAPYAIERSRHGGIALQRLAMWAEGSAWRQADSVIAVTTHLADIVAAAGVPRERVCVMSNGIDTAAFQAPRAAGAEQELGLGAFTVLGFTGFVREWNGLEAAIDLLVDPDLRGVFLLIIGDGPARASLEERARRLGVDARMRFTGLVERSQIPGLVSAVDVALQPAANPYASPLKLFEYMALGRAIVAPDQPNIREILTHDKDAVLFDPESRGSFQSAVRRLVADAHLRARLGAAAAVTLRERKLTWHHNAERVIALAERLVARRSASNGRAVEGR